MYLKMHIPEETSLKPDKALCHYRPNAALRKQQVWKSQNPKMTALGKK